MQSFILVKVSFCDASVPAELHQITMNEGDETYTYDAHYDDTPGDGNTATASCEVMVPHDQQ